MSSPSSHSSPSEVAPASSSSSSHIQVEKLSEEKEKEEEKKEKEKEKEEKKEKDQHRFPSLRQASMNLTSRFSSALESVKSHSPILTTHSASASTESLPSIPSTSSSSSTSSTSNLLASHSVSSYDHLHPKWFNAREASACFKCSDKFSLTLRRHHCRSCGGVYCYRCSSHKAALPSYGFDTPVR
jgi:hypothetical protein